MFFKEEIFLTMDPSIFEKKLSILEKNGVKYIVKVDDYGRSNRGSGLLGNIGEAQKYKIIYRILVSKKIASYAKHILNL